MSLPRSTCPDSRCHLIGLPTRTSPYTLRVASKVTNTSIAPSIAPSVTSIHLTATDTQDMPQNTYVPHVRLVQEIHLYTVYLFHPPRLRIVPYHRPFLRRGIWQSQPSQSKRRDIGPSRRHLIDHYNSIPKGDQMFAFAEQRSLRFLQPQQISIT